VHNRHGVEVFARENKPLPLGEWHFVVFTVDGKELRLYRNGIQLAASACDGLLALGPTTLGVGVKLDESRVSPSYRNSGHWDGRIDDVAIFHRALTPEEIHDLMQRK
jgi:Concanavalin A-like lectin/glucanases superfamily